MKIGESNPVYASPRPRGGVTVIQSTSRILLSRDEARQLAEALRELTE